MTVDVFEATWLALTSAAFILTFGALVDARADQKAVRALNGHARELVASGIVRREMFRLAIQSLLLVAVIPAVFSPGDTPINVTTVALMLVPVFLVANSLFDSRERRMQTVNIVTEMLDRGRQRFDDLDEAIEENTRVTQEASASASAARLEASRVNDKIASRGDALGLTVDDTHERVVDIQDRTK